MSRHEARDLAGAVRRMANALIARAARGDDRALVELVGLADVVQAAITGAGAALYVRGDMSYTDIAGELGVTRQAARQRFAPAVALLRRLEEQRLADENKEQPRGKALEDAGAVPGEQKPGRLNFLQVAGHEFGVSR